MLFTTAAFALLYLPLVLAGFYLLGRHHRDAAALWLFVASLVFYGVWKPAFVVLLLASIVGNYLVGLRIARAGSGTAAARGWLIFGVSANLLLLAYYKYAAFLVGNLDLALGTHWRLDGIELPVGISFFTFTQIAFLADGYQKGVSELRFGHYGLFVTYFPHLVAGPVLHHAQMMPQFRKAETYRVDMANIVAGLAIFAIGLFKKVVLADGISPYADAIFNPADAGLAPSFVEAWLGALAYTFQIYFDFSGYSDMAIGLSLMFNITLPFNFDSPYKARNISEFWRRWHISLSVFLRDYLYIALGGNRHGAVRRYANLMTTMLLGGLWHGASWTFVFWGGLHGLYLMLNHGFQALRGKRQNNSRLGAAVGWALTMLCVVVAWVFFRAKTFDGASAIVAAMFKPDGAPLARLLWEAGLQAHVGLWACLLLGLVAVFAPNSNAIGQRLLAMCRARPTLRALLLGASLCAALVLVFVNTVRASASAFIYFNF